MKKLTVLTFVLFALGGCLWADLTGKGLHDQWLTFQRVFKGDSASVVEQSDFQEASLLVGYLQGVRETLSQAPLFGGKVPIAMPEEVLPDQLAYVVGKYLDDHPEEWSEPGIKLVLKALVKAFPKK